MTKYFYLATYINVTEQPARYRGWSLYFPDTGIELNLYGFKRFLSY